MSDSKHPGKNTDKTEKNEPYSNRGVFVKEDDQDWGSSGMNDIQKDSE